MIEYPINDEGVDLLKDFEQFAKTKPGKKNVAHAYWDDLGKVWTIGWGFTKGVKEGDTMTLNQADRRLAAELEEYADAVRQACKIEPNENQLAALTVCAWNIGIGGIRTSSMIRAHNRGDFQAAARAFGLWNKSGGKVVSGLTRRRAAESALYLKPAGDEHDEVEPMPQAVQGESSLMRSPIIQGTVGSATTGIATLASVADQASTAKSAWDVLNPLMPYLPYIAIAAILIVAGVVIWNRYQQRKGGWA